MKWFVDGDMNTKFFYNNENGKRKRLRIDEITSMEGDAINTDENIGAEAIRFFKE